MKAIFIIALLLSIVCITVDAQVSWPSVAVTQSATSTSSVQNTNQASGLLAVTNYLTAIAATSAMVSALQTNVSMESLTGTAFANVRQFGAVGDGVTDDTAAIQSALNSITNIAGGTVYFPVGVYLLNSGFQSQSGTSPSVKSAILLPVWAFTNGPNRTFRFLGEVPPAPTFGTANLNLTSSLSGSIILCTNAASSVTDAIIGSGAISGQGFSPVHLWLENLTFRTIPNPTCTAINAEYFNEFTAYNVTIDTGVYPPLTQPVNATFGIIMPRDLNGAWTRCENVMVANFNTGFAIGEHATLNNIIAQQCNVGFEIMAGTHSIWVGRSLMQQCQVGIKPFGTCFVSWENYDSEHTHIGTNTWMEPQYDLYDPNNYMSGILRYSIATAGGPQDAFLRSGGTKLWVTDLVTSKVAFGTTTPISTNKPISLSLGATYSSAALTPQNAKLKIYEDSADVIGFGAAPGRAELFGGTNTTFAFCFRSTEGMSVTSSGMVTSNGVFSGTVNATNGFSVSGLAGANATNSWNDAGGTNWTMKISGGIITSLTHSP